MGYGYGTYGDGGGFGAARGLRLPAPALAIDFLSSETLDPRIAATGGANGWRVNNAGLLVPQAAPRFDYDPVSLAPLGVKREPQAINLALWSEQFDNAAWAKNAATVTANQATAPSGALVADLLAGDGTNGLHEVRQTIASATAWAVSAFFHQGTERYATIYALGRSPNEDLGCQAILDLQTGTITLTGGTATSAVALAFGNGWYRFGLLKSSAWSTATTTEIRLGVTSLPNAGTSPTSGNVQCFGAMYEAGALTLSSYVQTTSATVTRTADALAMTGANFLNWYNPAAGTFILFGDWQKPTTTQPYVLSNGSNDRYIYDSNSAGTTMTASSYDGVGSPINTANSASGMARVASAYSTALAAHAICLNGGPVKSGAYDPTNWAANTALNLGEGSFCGHYRRLEYYNTRLSDVLMQRRTG